jgi:nicotinic acid phosphoribosyltransferase
MKEIDERGKRGVFIGVRHDSAEPVDALCGTVPILDEKSVLSFKEVPSYLIEDDTKLFRIIVKDLDAVHFRKSIRKNGIFDYKGQVYQMMSVDGEYLFSAFDEVGDEVGRYAILRPLNRPRTWEEKGMVETMYEIFGGSVNSKGYKVLNPGIKAVYGDSITITRARRIYKRLAIKGFAANNVSLGVGSFSFQALENEDGTLSPFTRDTFSVAIKCTHSKYVDEYGTVCERHVFKDPKGFSGKKSQKGLCRIFFNEDGELTYEDELYEADLVGKNSALVPYFKNGQEFKQNFEAIRETIDENL